MPNLFIAYGVRAVYSYTQTKQEKTYENAGYYGNNIYLAYESFRSWWL